MTTFQIIAAILVFAAAGGYLNNRFIGLPATIGHMGFALILSLMAIVCGHFGWFDITLVKQIVGQIDFTKVVLHGILSFLLFAGALHIDLHDLKSVKWAVAVLSTLGVILATVITGTLTWLAAHLIGIDLPLSYAFLFGALISPTDPIAVLSILKQARLSKNFYMMVGGESLFNDGVGVVVFLAVLGAAADPGTVHVQDFFLILARQSVGGIGFGLLLGWVTYHLMRSVDDYKVEIMLTLALVAGGYTIAEYLGISAPLCMVAAGLIVGNQGRKEGKPGRSRPQLDMFWELVDEILNAVLFLLVGLEIMIVPLSGYTIALGGMAVGAVLIGRLVSVALPITLMRRWQTFEPGTIRLLTWGGLRGGLSIAMALSLTAGPEKTLILAMTYIVVLFSILVQGVTFPRLIKAVTVG